MTHAAAKTNPIKIDDVYDMMMAASAGPIIDVGPWHVYIIGTNSLCECGQ